MDARGVSARATRGLTDFIGTIAGIKSRLMQAGVTLVGPLRRRWSVVVSGPLLYLGTALNLPPDSPRAGLQSCFMPMRSNCPSSLLANHLQYVFMGWFGSLQAQRAHVRGAEPRLGLSCFYHLCPSQCRVTCFAPCLHPLYIPFVASTAPCRQSAVPSLRPAHVPTLGCPHPPSTHAGSVAT